MKKILLHKVVGKEIEKLNMKTKTKIAESLDLLASGKFIGMPLDRPMPSVANGVHEPGIKDETGQYRVFYYIKNKETIVVFHQQFLANYTMPYSFHSF